MEEINKAQKQVFEAEAGLNYMLHLFGDDLAKREGYSDLHGIEAVQFYLVQKHHWLPSVVKAMTLEDIRFTLSQEMEGWTAPKSELR